MKKNDVSFHRTISKSSVAELPLAGFAGSILLIDNPSMVQTAKTLIRDCTVVGFDTETRPSFRKGHVNKVSLLQLATRDRAFLFRINRIGLPDYVLSILEDETILKIGVAIHDDLKSLGKIRPFQAAGFIDLQKYVEQFSIEDKGLKKLTANILGFRISKRLQTSNWEEPALSPQQLEYAATDAWVCYEIYDRLTRLEPIEAHDLQNL